MALTRVRRRSPWKLWIVPVLFVLLVGVVVRTQQDKILEKMGFHRIDTVSDQDIMVGDEMTLSGSLQSSSQLRYYTMLLHTVDQGDMGVKSTTLDLSAYRGKTVVLRGVVTAIVHGMPVVDVVSIVSAADETHVSPTVSNAQYVADAGIVLDPDVLKDFSVTNVTDSVMSFASAGGEVVDVTYFECTNDQSAQTGCRYIIEQLASAESRFTGVGGDQWVQLPETNTRFGTNNYRIGYKVVDVEKDVVVRLMSDLLFVNDRYVAKYLTAPAKDVCQTIDHTMDYVSSTDIDYSTDAVTLTLKGTDTEGKDVVCVVKGDPRTYDVSLLSLKHDTDAHTQDTSTYDEDARAEDDQSDAAPDAADDTTSSNTDPAPRLGIPYTFESAKGYSVIFPSSSIAFGGENNTESLGIDGVSGCWTQLNVVGRKGDDTPTDNPAVIMYDCANVASTIGPLGEYIRKDGVGSGKHFFIKVVNPAWKEFAQKIEVK